MRALLLSGLTLLCACGQPQPDPMLPDGGMNTGGGTNTGGGANTGGGTNTGGGANTGGGTNTGGTNTGGGSNTGGGGGNTGGGGGSTGGGGGTGNTCMGNNPAISYGDARFVNRMQNGQCPNGTVPLLDPCSGKCILAAECPDPDGTSPACRGFCANRNFYGVMPKGTADFECISSVSNARLMSSYWGNSCPLQQELELPTNLMLDCRCTTQKGRTNSDPRFQLCRGPQTFTGTNVRYGSGPSWVELRGDKAYTGGFIDQSAREFIVGARFSDSGFTLTGLIFAIHLETGVRRIISGTYPDPASGIVRVGCSATPTQCASGMRIADDLGGVEDVRQDPNDPASLIAYVNGAGVGTQLWRVNKATGTRTLIWAEVINAQQAAIEPSATMNSNQCWNGVPTAGTMVGGIRIVQLNPMGWAMDPQGNHYFGVIPSGAPIGPNGIIRVDAAGTSCTWVTRYFRDPPSSSGVQNGWRNMDLGTGPTSVVSGRWGAFLWHDGRLWANSDSAIARIDVATGNRTVVTNAAIQGAVGTGPAVGDRWLKWDPARNVLWSTGSFNSTVVTAVNVTDANRTDYVSPSGLNKPMGFRHINGSLQENFVLRGGFDIEDGGERDVIFIHNLRALVRWEVRTGNSHVISY